MGDAQGHTWGPKYALTESVNRLTHPVKTPKNAHNTRFFQPARSDRAGRSVALGPEIRGRTALTLRLSLRHNPLVNKRADRRRDYWRAPLLWRLPAAMDGCAASYPPSDNQGQRRQWRNRMCSDGPCTMLRKPAG